MKHKRLKVHNLVPKKEPTIMKLSFSSEVSPVLPMVFSVTFM